MFTLANLVSAMLGGFAVAMHIAFALGAYSLSRELSLLKRWIVVFFSLMALFCLSETVLYSGLVPGKASIIWSTSLPIFMLTVLSMILQTWGLEHFCYQWRQFLPLFGALPGIGYTYMSSILSAEQRADLATAYRSNTVVEFMALQAQLHPQDELFYISFQALGFVHLLVLLALIGIIYSATRELSQRFAHDPSVKAGFRSLTRSFLITGLVCVLISGFLPAFLTDLKLPQIGVIMTIPFGWAIYQLSNLGHQRLDSLKGQRDRLTLFLPKLLVDKILRNHDADTLGGTESNGTVLFCDIRNFTSYCESVAPGEVIAFLNLYFRELNKVIHAHHGTVNKYIGDEIMVFFGIGQDSQTSAQSALNCALAMLHKVKEINHILLSSQQQAIQIGIGIHEGRLVHGNIGSEERMEFTVLGDTVNIAARITDLCKKENDAILVSEHLYELLFDHKHKMEFYEILILRGRKTKTPIYRLKKAWNPLLHPLGEASDNQSQAS